MRFSCLKDGHGSSQHEERARNSIGFADLANGRDLQKRLRQSENFLPSRKSRHVCITRVEKALSLCQAAFRSSASNVSFGVGLKVWSSNLPSRQSRYLSAPSAISSALFDIVQQKIHRDDGVQIVGGDLP
jgi:predicted alpha/beta hydrolase